MTIERNSPLAQTYLSYRQKGYRPKMACAMAWGDITQGKRGYPKSGELRYYVGNWEPESPGAQWYVLDQRERAYYSDGWPVGFRMVGRCDKVDESRVEHTGWFLDHEEYDQSETVCGYVLQLPARNGKPRFIPGVQSRGEDGVTTYPNEHYEFASDAAMAADGYAERYAEIERDYRAASNAGNRAAEYAAEAKRLRREALTALADLRSVKSLARYYTDDMAESRDRLCRMARENVARMRRAMREAQESRDELVSQWQGNSTFADSYGDA